MKKHVLLPLAAFAGLALASLSPTSAQLVSQCGILDLTANGGINPNTGVAWAAGDTYRLAFFTAETTTATSNDPAFYNDFVTSQAHQNTALAGINFFALVSVNLDGTMTQADSPKINARENSGTTDLTGGAVIGGAGSPVFAMNGTTAIARNNADIWDGFSDAYASGNQRIRLASGTTNLNSDGNPVTATQNVHYSPFLNQFGLGDTANIHGFDIRTGSNSDGTPRTPLGTTTDNTNGNIGASNANDPGRVWVRFDNRDLSIGYRFYAISEPLTVQPAPAEAFQLRIAPSTTSPGGYDFEWDSQPGKVYDLVTSTDLATPVATWPVYDPDGEGGNDPYGDIPATGTTTTLTEVPGDGSKRFFAMVEKDAPPLFSWDFEADGAGFISIEPTDWAWGTPNSNNGFGLVLTTGNGGSTGAWATNLGAGGNPSGLIDPTANSILRSPDIDLTGITGAQLSFAAAYDAAAGDVIEIVIRNAGTGDPIGAPIAPIDTTSATFSDWTTLGPFDLSAADNTNIYLEFRYDGTSASYIGFYLDDVVVTQN